MTVPFLFFRPFCFLPLYTPVGPRFPESWVFVLISSLHVYSRLVFPLPAPVGSNSVYILFTCFTDSLSGYIVCRALCHVQQSEYRLGSVLPVGREKNGQTGNRTRDNPKYIRAYYHCTTQPVMWRNHQLQHCHRSSLPRPSTQPCALFFFVHLRTCLAAQAPRLSVKLTGSPLSLCSSLHPPFAYKN
jgi:hypothetical protein